MNFDTLPSAEQSLARDLEQSRKFAGMKSDELVTFFKSNLPLNRVA